MRLLISSELRLLLVSLVIVSEIALISGVDVAIELKVPPKPSRKSFALQVSNFTNNNDDHDAITKHQMPPDGLLDGPQVVEDDGLSDEPIVRANLRPKKRPLIRFDASKITSSQSDDNKQKREKKQSFMSGKFLKDSVKSAYKSTKNYIKEASDSLALAKGQARLAMAIEDAKDDIKSVRREYSLFTVSLSPVIESALNYIGATGLHSLKWDPNDEFDYRLDALHALAFGYEFMRLLNAWRESLLPAHEAYKHYLQLMKQNLVNPQEVDDELFVQLKTIHMYLLLNGWLSYDELSKEPKEKLEYLMSKVNTDGGFRNDFERSYLRQVLSLSSIFEKTRDKFQTERQQVVDMLEASGAESDSFPEVDEFFDQFRDALDVGQLPGIEWRVPEKMEKFMEKLAPELRLNPLVYDTHFLWRLEHGKL